MLVAKYAKLLPESSKNCLIQIGAHEGHEAEVLEAAGFKSIAWIEADPDIFKVLKANITNYHNAKHTAHNALITSTTGEKHRFYRYSNEGASSSLYQPTSLFIQTFDGVTITENSIELSSISLDDFIQAYNLSPSTLIIDVQGAELEVLSGGKEALQHTNIVEVEISQQKIYDGGALFQQVDELLKNAGFIRITRVPWHGDVIYINPGKFNLSVKVMLKIFALKYALSDFFQFIPRLLTLFFAKPIHTFNKAKQRLF